MNTTPFEANEYDAGIRKNIPYYETINNEVLDLVKIMRPNCKTWLDTGCGTGYLVSKAVASFQATFYCCDPASDMLGLAQERLGKLPSGKFNFMESSSENLPANDLPKMNVVTAILAHHFCTPEQRVAATRRCFDLLNTGGLFITVEMVRPRSKESTTIALERWSQWKLAQGLDAETVKSHLSRFDTKYFPITLDEHFELLKTTGFKIYDVFWYSQMQAGFYGVK